MHAPREVILTYLVAVQVNLSLASRVYLSQDGGYRGIIVKIHPSVRRESCEEVIRNLKDVLTGTSEKLFRASGKRVWFGRVSLVVPTLWTNKDCGQQINYPGSGTPYKGEDIRVVSDDRIHGSRPTTTQHRLCGQPGERISLSEQFILDLNRTEQTWGSPQLLLLNQWVKYRYGVFDDQGYLDDPLYPVYTQDAQNRVLVTGTTNAMIRGAWTLTRNQSLNCDPRKEADCLFFPDESRNNQISCSLSTLPFLSGVKDWCSPEEAFHPASPSKHNIICKGRSVHQVIHAHPDFRNGPAATNEMPFANPEFDIIRQPVPEYVILLETSANMKQIWKWVRKGLQNLIRFELPENSRVAIVTFNKEVKVEQTMTRLTSESVRVRVADTIPDNHNKLSNLQDRCVSCAVQAVREVLTSDKAGGHIILVTQGDAKTLSSAGEASIEEYEATHGITFSSILLPLVPEQKPLPFYQSIADRSGGMTYTLTSDNGIYLLATMIKSLRGIVRLNSQEVSETLHMNRVSKLPGTQVTRGQFFVDSFLGRDTRFGIFVEDEEDHRILSINLTDSCGETFGPYTKMSSDFDIINFKTINFLVGDPLPFQEIGRGWTYEIQWLSQPKTTNNVIMVTSKHRSLDPSNHLETSISVTDTFPHIIYVHVTQGGVPVLNAGVQLSAEYHGPNGPEALTSGLLQVPDDGAGDPDIQSGDGVYSRYLTWTPGPGEIHITVMITDAEGQAYSITPGPTLFKQPAQLKIPTCCGSSVQVPMNRRKKLDTFERLHSTTINAVPAYDQDFIPPSKISDFTAEVHGNGNITMSWTAVGGDKLDGQTDVYRLHFSKNVSELVVEESTQFLEFTEYGLPGSKVRYSVSAIDTAQPYHGYVYMAIQAGDMAANFGRFSNLVLVDFGDNPDSYSTQPSGIESIITEDWTLIGGIVGVILILILTLLAVVISVMCSKRRNMDKGLKKTRSSGVNVHIPSPSRSDATDNSYDSDHQLVPPMNKPPSSTSFAANLTPTYWSASQLLSHHEKRTGTLNREKSKTSGSSQGSHHTNNNQYMYQTDMYDGYTITPLHDAPKASIYGTAADVVYGTTYGYGVYTGPPANVHVNGGGMADYGGIVVPNGRTSVVSPPRHEEFSHLDYGVVTQSDLEYAASDLADEESGNVKPSDNSSSTLPTFTNSIRGSTLSLNSAKKKNITQV